METTPRFLQGVYAFTGTGLDVTAPIGAGLVYTVPGDKRAQLIYLRAGNSSAELISLVLLRDGKPMRLFPVGAKADTHVPLAVVEDLEPDTKIELQLAAGAGVTGMVVIDVGLLEI
jgi:hypothetical protein